MSRSWKIWIDEYRALHEKRLSGVELTGGERSHYQYLKNLLEAGLGTKGTVSEDCRRDQIRVPSHLKAKIIKPFEADATAENISEGGLLFSMDHDVPDVGAEVEFILDTAGKTEPLKFSGVVQWGKTPPNAKLGVKFDEPTDELKAKLYKFFYELLEEVVFAHVNKG